MTSAIMTPHETLVTIILAIIGSGGFWSLLQFIATKHSEKRSATAKMLLATKESIIKISQQQENILKTIDENEAKGARRRILRFSDELNQEIRHTKDYFDDVLADIDLYEKYCKDHPDFPNNRTLMAETNIKAVYQQCLAEHDFL